MASARRRPRKVLAVVTAAVRSWTARGRARLLLMEPCRSRQRYTVSLRTSTLPARKWAGTMTGMSSKSTPSGKARACLSQKSLRNTLLQAIRSPSRSQSRRTWVVSRVVDMARRNIGDCSVVPSVFSRWTLPVTKSEPLRSRVSSISA